MKNNFKTRVCNINDKQHIPFLKCYKFLFEDKNYQSLPYQAKAMYTYIANKQVRVLKSKKGNAYIDNNGDPFVIYSIKDLENDLKLSNSSAKKYKRILVEYDLISTSNRGMHIYVKTPNLSSSLTYADGKKLSYFHMPKFFDTNPNYNNASLLTRLVYTLQKERFTLTLANVDTKKSSNYIDERGRVFCTYSNQSLARMLNVCEKKIIDSKKELEALGLLKQKKQGLNEPNRLYLYTPLNSEQLSVDEFLEQDQPIESKRKFVLVPPEKSMSGCVYKGKGFKNTVRNGLNIQSSNTGFSNTVINNTYNSMYSLYSMYLSKNLLEHKDDTKKTYESTRKEMKLKSFKFSKSLKAYLMNFSSHDLGIVLKKLASAKNHYNQNYDTNFTLEDIDIELLNMLKRLKVVMYDKNKTVEDMGGYFYQSTINELKAFEIKQIESGCNNSAETVDEFNQRWLDKIKEVSHTLNNNKVECARVVRSERLFTHKCNQNNENDQFGYVDEMGVPY